MKTYKIAVQEGLEPVVQILKSKGHEVFPYTSAGLQADIVVISGVSSEYEEMETAQCMISGPDGQEKLIINASELSPEQVLDYIEKNPCKP